MLDRVGLGAASGRRIGTYSKGMRQRLGLAQAMLGEPRVLLLDEPTSGLDPLSTRRLKDLLVEQSARGTTVFLSTHGLELAEQICHRVGILARGALQAEGTVAELRARHADRSLEDVFLATTEPAG